MREIFWVDSDGTSINLTEYAVIERGVSGLGLPPFKRDERWLGAYGALAAVQVQARDVVLPIVVAGTDYNIRSAALMRAFSPLRGDGTLVVRDDAKTRVLRCRYAGGLEGRDTAPGYHRHVVRLRALQPYWQAESAKNFMFMMQPPVTFFQSPFFPLRISSGAINGDVTVANDGDVDAYPIVIASGAFTSLAVTNLDTNRTMTFAALTMTDGDSLVIDTRPSALTVRLNGANAFGLMSAASSLWTIAPGENHLQLVTTGTNSNSTVTISFTEQFLTV